MGWDAMAWDGVGNGMESNGVPPSRSRRLEAHTGGDTGMQWGGIGVWMQCSESLVTRGCRVD